MQTARPQALCQPEHIPTTPQPLTPQRPSIPVPLPRATAPLQVLQHDLQGKSRRRSSLSAVPELVVGECLGKGGYGKVYKALWHKAVVAAKVMPVNAGEREVRWRAPGFKG